VNPDSKIVEANEEVFAPGFEIDDFFIEQQILVNNFGFALHFNHFLSLEFLNGFFQYHHRGSFRHDMASLIGPIVIEDLRQLV
jgi:hypothetical protein